MKWSLKHVPRELRGIGRKLLYGSVMSGDDYQRACKVVWWRSAIEDMRTLGGFDWSREWPEGCRGWGSVTNWRSAKSPGPA